MGRYPFDVELSDLLLHAGLFRRFLKIPEIFMHYSLLPKLGLPLGELWDLDELAADCRDDGRLECFMVSAPYDCGTVSHRRRMRLA